MRDMKGKFFRFLPPTYDPPLETKQVVRKVLPF